MPEQKESIKLSKMSKGYNWEIKILRQPGQTVDQWFNEVKAVDDKLKTEYGNKE